MAPASQQRFTGQQIDSLGVEFVQDILNLAIQRLRNKLWQEMGAPLLKHHGCPVSKVLTSCVKHIQPSVNKVGPLIMLFSAKFPYSGLSALCQGFTNLHA